MKYDNTLSGIILNGYGGIAFETNGTNERLRINSGGMLSIGKTGNAGKAIEIYQASYAALRIQNSSTGTGGNDGILIEAAGSDALFYNYETANVRFGTAGTERARITSGGDLLLGGHSAYTYDDTGASNVILDIYGGATAGKRGILSLSGRTGSDNGDLGTIWFNNDNNSSASPGNNMKLAAAIQAKAVTLSLIHISEPTRLV